MGLERINGAKLTSVLFYKTVNDKGVIGCVDFNSPISSIERPYRRFLFIALKDWEGEKSMKSMITTLHNLLEKALMDDSSVNFVVERREVPDEQLKEAPLYDFLVKADNVKAYTQ